MIVALYLAQSDVVNVLKDRIFIRSVLNFKSLDLLRRNKKLKYKFLELDHLQKYVLNLIFLILPKKYQ